MYLVEYLGDLSLALDPNPPPETPTGEQSLDVSELNETPLQEPSINTIPTVLKDMTNTTANTQKAAQPAKKPGINLFKPRNYVCINKIIVLVFQKF